MSMMGRRLSSFSRLTGAEIADLSNLFLPEIEAENPDYRFIQVDRDAYLDLAKEWDVYGIPSLVVLEKGQEIGRLVNRDRKTKGQINEFLASIREKGSVK